MAPPRKVVLCPQCQELEVARAANRRLLATCGRTACVRAASGQQPGQFSGRAGQYIHNPAALRRA